MPADQDDILRLTVSGLEGGLQVLHVAATDLKICDADADVQTVLDDSSLAGFDQIPVKDKCRIVGVLERRKRSMSGTVRQHMRPLDDTLLISASAPLTRVLTSLTETSYRLVIKDTDIVGIVTPSDFAKLPVRLFAFCLITHLEMVMARLIRAKELNGEALLDLLPETRRKPLRDRLQQRKKENMQLPLLEVTGFFDKALVLSRVMAVDDHFLGAMARIKKLRDKIAHPLPYADNQQQLIDFTEVLEQAQLWIARLGGKATVVQAALAAL